MGGSMSSLVIAGDSSGAITLQAPSVAGTNTLTLPAATGTLALTSGSQTFTNLTVTNDASISGLTVGKGGGSSAATVVGSGAAAASNASGTPTAFGYKALAVDVSGGLNSAFGYQALTANTTGTDNTAIGSYNALRSNTSGTANIAIGREALQANTTASNNTAVGYQAGYSQSTNPYNTYIGRQAGYSSTGSDCTFVGNGSGYYTTGSFNTLIGDSAGFQITSGAKNTVLGCFPGNQGGLDIRTASNYIVLSDGDGNPRCYFNGSGYGYVPSGQFNIGSWSSTGSSSGITLTNPDISGGLLSTTTTASNVMFRFYNPNGQVGGISTSGSATTYATSSDYRLKENVQPMTGALATVSQLKPVTYDWISDKSKGQGFIAHELQAVVPDCVTGEKDAVNEDGSIKAQGIDTSFLVATLTAAIQELNTLVTTQAAEIAALKAKVGA